MKTTVRSALAALLAVSCIAIGTLVTADEPKVGVAAPEFQAAGFLNAEKAPTLADLKGKVVVVEFWATWCPPCKKSIPHLIEMHEKHAKSGLVIVGLTREKKDVVEPFVKDMKMTYAIGYESTSGGAYGVKTIPQAFVVGSDGKVTWAGNPLGSRDAFDKAVEAALAAAKGS